MKLSEMKKCASLWRLTYVVLGLMAGAGFTTSTLAQTASPASDVVVFKNGDQLTGKLERSVGSDIVFKSDALGEITVSMDKVKEVRSSGNFVVLKKDEKI